MRFCSPTLWASAEAWDHRGGRGGRRDRRGGRWSRHGGHWSRPGGNTKHVPRLGSNLNIQECTLSTPT
jgi:hypothetical protein